MDQEAIRVLLISETEHGCSNLRRALEIRECKCVFAGSFNEAASLIDQHSFHLVLCTISFLEYDRLLAKLSELPATVFQSFLVEDGCWWLPLAKNGKPCIGTPALRANEFVGAIDHILEEVRPKREKVLRVGL